MYMFLRNGKPSSQKAKAPSCTHSALWRLLERHGMSGGAQAGKDPYWAAGARALENIILATDSYKARRACL